MRTRAIGQLQASVIGLGCNNFGRRLDEAATRRVVDAALDVGINFFDTADVYGGSDSESFLGRILDGRRDQVLLATKFGMPMGEGRQGADPAYVKRALTDSLKRLRVDHVDLYQLHRPDPDVPLSDTLGALGELVEAGWVREIGCSNFGADQLAEAEAAVPAGAPRFASVQNEYSLIHREPEAEVLPACERLGLAFLPYFPLASGLLTGKYRRGQPLPEGARIPGNPRFEPLLSDAHLALVEDLVAYAAERGYEVLDLAFAYLLAQPTVASVIAGATASEQVRRNAATAAWTMNEVELAEVERILSEHPDAKRA